MAKNKNIFVTITGFQHYYGREPFQIGNLIRCAKEPSNPYDSDAIRAFLPYIGKVGYIANSPQTKAGGTDVSLTWSEDEHYAVHIDVGTTAVF